MPEKYLGHFGKFYGDYTRSDCRYGFLGTYDPDARRFSQYNQYGVFIRSWKYFEPLFEIPKYLENEEK